MRKSDGTWWDVTATEISSPNSNALVKIELGEQIADEKTILECEEYFHRLFAELENKMKKGDRVRVIRTATMGRIIGVGSVPGVPKIFNVAYDGGGGCNHMPEELQIMKDDLTPK